MPIEKRWRPDQVPGFLPGVGPAAGRGSWVEIYVESPAERQAAYRSAEREAERVVAQGDWIASRATASEMLEAVSPGHRPRLFRGEPLRDGWARLVSEGGLPSTECRLHTVRRRHRRTLRGATATDEPVDRSVPIWPVPRGDSGVIVYDYLDADGALFTPRCRSITAGETHLLVVVAGRDADGCPVERVTSTEAMGPTVNWTKEVLPSAYVAAVCSALRHALAIRAS